MRDDTVDVVYCELINGRRVLICHVPGETAPYALRIDGELVCQCATRDEAVQLGHEKTNNSQPK